MQIGSDRRTFYERIGGEQAVRHLVQRFYARMDSLQEAKTIRTMHARSLKGSEQKLFMFLSGWMGGPALYMEKYGHPRLRMRHLPFAIDDSARDQWMLCMKRALEDVVEDQALRDELLFSLHKVADFMRNQPE